MGLYRVSVSHPKYLLQLRQTTSTRRFLRQLPRKKLGTQVRIQDETLWEIMVMGMACARLMIAPTPTSLVHRRQ
jgi:hypothetical protein